MDLDGHFQNFIHIHENFGVPRIKNQVDTDFHSIYQPAQGHSTQCSLPKRWRVNSVTVSTFSRSLEMRLTGVCQMIWFDHKFFLCVHPRSFLCSSLLPSFDHWMIVLDARDSSIFSTHFHNCSIIWDLELFIYKIFKLFLYSVHLFAWGFFFLD